MALPVKKTKRNLPPGAGPGRPKGCPNKSTSLLKDAILIAAERAGDKAGMIGYLEAQANKHPVAFLSLLGRVLPLQIANAPGQAFKTENVIRIEFVNPGSNT